MLRICIATALLIAGVGQALAADMTADEIKAKLIGHELAWKSAKFKASGVTLYNADGSATITIEGAPSPEKGKWRINKKGLLCDKFGKNKESCSAVQQVDDKTFFMPAYESTAVIK